MSQEFDIEILTPTKKLYAAKGSEALLPAYDGEVGILPGHCNFVGKLGTGALKVVTGGNDFWFAVSGGVYQVQQGLLTVFAQVGEGAETIDREEAKSQLELLDEKLKAASSTTEQEAIREERDRQRARLEVHRRTDVVN